MFSTFTTESGALIIRTALITRLSDRPPSNDGSYCNVAWVECGELKIATVIGTAQENLTRIEGARCTDLWHEGMQEGA